MPRAASSLLAFLAAPALAQEVRDCDPVPPATALIEPWEETSATLRAGAIRLALLEGEGGQELLVLTLPPPGEEEPDPTAPPPERRCRVVAEGGIGFAALDLSGMEVTEDAEAATLLARLPALRFVPESTELEEVALLLTLGVSDGSLAATLEETVGAGKKSAPDPEPEAEEAP